MRSYSVRDVQRVLRLSPAVTRGLIRAGFVKPGRGPRRAYRLSFQDLIVLRTAGSLRAAKIPAQRINRTLKQIRDSLPGELPLSGLSIVAVGDRIVVREGRALRESDTGQYTLALEVIDKGGGDLAVIDRHADRG